MGHGFQVETNIVAILRIILEGDGLVQSIAGHHVLEVGKEIGGGVGTAGAKVELVGLALVGDGRIGGIGRGSQAHDQHQHQHQGEDHSKRLFHNATSLTRVVGCNRIGSNCYAPSLADSPFRHTLNGLGHNVNGLMTAVGINTGIIL